MPHKLAELNAMSEAELRALGEKLNIKGAAKMDIHSLGFAILDTEAVIEAQKPAEPKPAKKRGRPKKDAAKTEAPKPAESAPKEEAVKPAEKPAQKKEETPAPAADKPAPKKRGRKPKAVVDAEAAAAAAKEASAPAETPQPEANGKKFIQTLFDDLKDDDANPQVPVREGRKGKQPKQPERQPENQADKQPEKQSEKQPEKQVCRKGGGDITKENHVFT